MNNELSVVYTAIAVLIVQRRLCGMIMTLLFDNEEVLYLFSKSAMI